MDIGERLKNARKAIGYTQEKASTESGIGVSSISEFETSTREPSFSQLSLLAEIYKRTIDFFFADDLPPENIMLWRDKPEDEELEKKHEAEFRQHCEQYHNIEVCLGEVKRSELPLPQTKDADLFSYADVDALASKVQREFQLGDIPSASLKQVLEEKFYVKIFYLPFCGSAISTWSTFGPAILLNQDSKLWRRNFDLAHELFHLLTWNIFRSEDSSLKTPSEQEEKFANVFASRLLLPAESVRDRIKMSVGPNSHISIEDLDEVAREFGVSLEALLWRMLYLYNKSADEVEELLQRAKDIKPLRPRRQSDKPDKLPERYCSLAIRSLRNGRLSLLQFKKYMDMTYRQAQEYLMDEDDFREENISIPAA